MEIKKKRALVLDEEKFTSFKEEIFLANISKLDF